MHGQKNVKLPFMSAATLKPIRLESPSNGRLSATNKVNLFRADSLARYVPQCAQDSSVVALDVSRCKFGQTCRIKCSHTCLAMYDQTNIVLLCCVGFGSIVAAT